MKNLLFCLLAVLLSPAMQAQTSDSLMTADNDTTLQLKEVEVQAAKIVSRADGMLYLPTTQQKASSANGYDLLGQLSMPMIRVDASRHTISAVDNKGVQVRLNGALTTKADLQSLDPQLIRSVEFINNPGVRYGDDVGYVINIRTRRADAGYTVGTDLTQAANRWQGDDMVYARWNHKNSELGLTYDFGYLDSRKNRYRESADYLLSDGTHRLITRQDSARRSRYFSNNIELKYNLADSASYVFQATLSADFLHHPGDWRYQYFSDVQIDKTSQLDRNKSFSPVIDLYFYHTLGRHQSITANVVGTAIATDEYNFNNEGSDYAYSVDGNTWSLMSEAVYENRLKPFTVSLGINHLWKYTRNIYTGDAQSVNNMHNSNLYLFGEVKGSIKRLSYTAGLGVTNLWYRQATAQGSSFNYWLFRPKATLTYRISQPLSVSYSIQVSQRMSQIAMISDASIRTNSLEWTVGNPDLEPTHNTTQGLTIAFSTPRLYTQFYTEWRQNTHCNMAFYERTPDNQFLYMQSNQRHVNMLYCQNYTSWTVIPERLTATFTGGIYRFFNKGDTYNHLLTAYNVSGSLQAYLGHWTLTAQVDNGWKFMEGETWNHQGSSNSIRCSYRLGNCQLSLTCYNPFEAHPRLNHAQLVNRYIHKDMSVRSADAGNALFIGFTWKLNRGRKYRDIDRSMQNSDTQTGVL